MEKYYSLRNSPEPQYGKKLWIAKASTHILYFSLFCSKAIGLTFGRGAEKKENNTLELQNFT